MKIVAKCSDFLSLSYQVQVKVCSPIPLTKTVQCMLSFQVMCRIFKIIMYMAHKIENNVDPV